MEENNQECLLNVTYVSFLIAKCLLFVVKVECKGTEGILLITN